MILDLKFAVERKLGDPLIRIVIDDYLVLYEGPAQENFHFDFHIDNGSHVLKIIHYGKECQDHIIEDNIIIVDKHIEIKEIKMDNVELTSELWEGKFYPVYMHRDENEPVFITPNLYLGHNGTWTLDFASPATKWLIEKRNNGPKIEETIFKTNKEILEKSKNFFKDLPDV